MTRTKIQTVEILQQIPKCGILFFGLTKINLRVEIDSPEYVAQLSAVVFLDMVQRYINFLAYFRIIPIGIKIIKGRLLVHRKTLTTHGTLYPAHIAIILLNILLTLLFGNIAEVLHKQHRENIILISGTVDFAAETITGIPQDLLNIFSGCHFHFPFFALLYA